MAKLAFTKLGLKINNITNILKLGENEIEIKYYLPVEKKLEVMSNIINQSLDENGYYNPMRLKIYTTLEIIYAYTNISFTDKMKEDPFKLYDLFISTGLYEKILENICVNDINEIKKQTKSIIENIYNYKNSALGILNAISADYSNLNLDINDIINKLSDPESLTLVKEIAPLV